MRVVEHQALDEPGNESGVLDLFTQMGQRWIDIEQIDRVATMYRAGQAGNDQLQSVGMAVAGDLALTQFQLMQCSFYLFFWNALFGDADESVAHQLLNFCSRVAGAAFKTTHQAHFAVAVFQPAQRGG